LCSKPDFLKCDLDGPLKETRRYPSIFGPVAFPLKKGLRRHGNHDGEGEFRFKWDCLALIMTSRLKRFDCTQVSFGSRSRFIEHEIAQARESAAKDSKQAAVIDVTKYGIFKVLGKGELPEQPLLVKAKFVSKLAEKKIKEVGGAVQLIA
jgi:ribosomal protein L15